MVFTLLFLGGLITNLKSVEHINAAWLIGPVGNLVVAIAMPVIDADYKEAAWFWFAPGLFFFPILLTITFQRVVLGANADDRMRPLMFIWLAAPSVAVPAYLTMLSSSVYELGGAEKRNCPSMSTSLDLSSAFLSPFLLSPHLKPDQQPADQLGLCFAHALLFCAGRVSDAG